MGCERYREALSARLDGEDGPAGRVDVDAHLAACPACRQWYADAAAVTRLARIGLAVAGRGVSDQVLDAVPGRARHVRGLLTGLRLLLGVLGVAQLLLAVAQVALPAHGMTMGGGMSGTAQGATGGHLLHESAAWNFALGVGFLLIAWRRRPPAGLVPVLTAFLAALTLLTADDLITAAVGWSRIASHLLVLTGYLVVVLLSRAGGRLDTPPGASRPDRSWRLPSADGEAPGAAPRWTRRTRHDDAA